MIQSWSLCRSTLELWVRIEAHYLRQKLVDLDCSELGRVNSFGKSNACSKKIKYLNEGNLLKVMIFKQSILCNTVSSERKDMLQIWRLVLTYRNESKRMFWMSLILDWSIDLHTTSENYLLRFLSGKFSDIWVDVNSSLSYQWNLFRFWSWF